MRARSEKPRTQTSGRTAYEPRPDDSQAVAAWRQRMGTPEGQTTYRQRSGIAEWTNAQLRLRLSGDRETLAKLDAVVKNAPADKYEYRRGVLG